MYNIIMESPYIVIISHLLFIVITFWALQAINYEKFIKKNHVTQARLLFVIISIALGYTLSNFFLDYLGASKQLLNFIG
ncbi:DUF1146 family protein [Listeria ivanovii]|uniref:DUF1146 domain-containing protein n=2 Tax=Listeria ivanovii TaxID=1638 RepID=A0ABS1G5X8_LISIV|nr:DUF1146 family protein [Listeria ivanovii]EFR95823.1 conserved domain protein [Listeria ivanovii FSL F6-596]AIS60844.1 membrane protein [Listeria ivanovii subsp. londoniensis]AIS63670.1 membrane protein [Listeria ivanovii subsp. londoniensis]MBC2255000.1 DUF1146 domain-containing protein [Listeria ivanovii]MBK1962278.1 DUF1146 domain-containing protein [Listeria ivanovii subsp. londoniensis]